MSKFVVSGTRRLRDYAPVANAMLAAIEQFGCVPTTIIEGGQRGYRYGVAVGGADYFASVWAKRHNVPCETRYAQWQFGKKAGPVRNREMAKEGDYLVAIPDDKSTGTTDMIKAMQEAGKGERIYISHALLKS